MSKKCIAFVALIAAGVATAQETAAVSPLEVAENAAYDLSGWDSARQGDTVAPATGGGRVSSADPSTPLTLLFDDSYDFTAEHALLPTHTPTESTEVFDAPHPAFEPYVKWGSDSDLAADADADGETGTDTDTRTGTSPACRQRCAALRKKAACCKRKCAAVCKRTRCARVCRARAEAVAANAATETATPWGEREFNRELQNGRAFGVHARLSDDNSDGGAWVGEALEEEEPGLEYADEDGNVGEWSGPAHTDGGADEDEYELQYSDDATLPSDGDGRDDETLFFPGFGFGGLAGGLAGGINIGGIGIGGAIGGGIGGGGYGQQQFGGPFGPGPYGGGGQFQSGAVFDPKFGGQIQGSALDPKFGGFGGGFGQQGGAVIAAPPQAGFGGGFFGAGGGGFGGGFGGPRFF